MSKAEAITDHDHIRTWADARGGRPAVVEDTHGKSGDGILRFDFGDKDDGLKQISWDEFFEIFEDRKLALLEQDKTKGGDLSRFFKFVAR